MQKILREVKKNGVVIFKRALRTDYKLDKLEVNVVELKNGYSEVMIFGATKDIFNPIVVDSNSTKEEIEAAYKAIKNR